MARFPLHARKSPGSHPKAHHHHRLYKDRTPTSKIMSAIRKLKKGPQTSSTLGKISTNIPIQTAEFRTVLDLYYDTKDMVLLTVSVDWEKECKAVDTEKLHRVIYVLSREMKQRNEDGSITTTHSLSAAVEGEEIYISSKPK